MDNVDTLIVLGHDLQLVITYDEQAWRLLAVDGNGEQLAQLGSTLREPGDALITAARASAIAQFPLRAGWENLAAGVGEVVKIHAFDRDRSTPVGVYRCKHCDYSPRHAVHDTSTVTTS